MIFAIRIGSARFCFARLIKYLVFMLILCACISSCLYYFFLFIFIFLFVALSLCFLSLSCWMVFFSGSVTFSFPFCLRWVNKDLRSTRRWFRWKKSGERLQSRTRKVLEPKRWTDSTKRIKKIVFLFFFYVQLFYFVQIFFAFCVIFIYSFDSFI